MLYPFVMEPVYKDYLWGGRNLENMGKRLPEGRVAEAWEASAHPDGLSLVNNGIFGGKTLRDVVDMYPAELLGVKISRLYGKQFPLMFKLIDATDQLSVQVHPDDAYARAKEGQRFGKLEAWYILDAAPDAEIVYGLVSGTDRKALEKALSENRIEDCLHRVCVQAGDLIEVQPGTVHAIGSGIVLAELQQSSNLTYRVYDWGRLDAHGHRRALHLEQAMDVIDFEPDTGNHLFSSYTTGEYKKASMLRNRIFALEALNIKNKWAEETLDSFRILFVCEGRADILYAGGILHAEKGQTIFLPAALRAYAVSGACRILRMQAMA